MTVISFLLGAVMFAIGAILVAQPRIVEVVLEFIARPALERWEREEDNEVLKRYRRGMPLLRILAAAFFFLFGAVLIMRSVT